MTILTKELLLTCGACDEGISFCERNKLFGFDLSRIAEIKGDYNGFIDWLKGQVSIKMEYDSNGNIIKQENSDGYWKKWEYDSQGKMIKEENSMGEFFKLEYDSHGNKIKRENSNGYWVIWCYDTQGNNIKYENSYGYCKEWEHDTHGNKIKQKTSHGRVKTYEIEYYPDGQLKRYDDLYLPLV